LSTNKSLRFLCQRQVSSTTVVAVAVEDNLSAIAAGNESVDGRMTACDDEIGQRTTTQQPTNEQRRGGGGSRQNTTVWRMQP
jgi:hypothetical protein